MNSPDENSFVDLSDESLTLELEKVLCLDSCDHSTLCEVSRCRPFPHGLRAQCWFVCLVQDRDASPDFPAIFDLPEQDFLHSDVLRIAHDSVSEEAADRLIAMSEIESVVTLYCRSEGAVYSPHSGWLHVVRILYTAGLSQSQIYSCFRRILRTFLPRDLDSDDSDTYHLLRLILLYHAPDLCSFLDSRRVHFHSFSRCWMATLFASKCSTQAIYILWDLYFQLSDPFLLYYFCLVMLVNAKDSILSMGDASPVEISEYICDLPLSLQSCDVTDFCALAQYFLGRTPRSFQLSCAHLLFTEFSVLSDTASVTQRLCDTLCVQVAAEEVVSAFENSHNPIQYFLLDCRTAVQYNSGHFSNAFHLDATLMLSNMESFNTAVSTLLSIRDQTQSQHRDRSKHICCIGTGVVEEDQLLHMVLSTFLHRRYTYVSSLSGGYKLLHSFLSQTNRLHSLVDHSVTECSVCLSLTPPRVHRDSTCTTAPGWFSKVGVQWKHRLSQALSDTFSSHLTVSDPSHRTYLGTVSKSSSGSSRAGVTVRNFASIFTLDDDDVAAEANSETSEVVELSDEEVTVTGDTPHSNHVCLNEFLSGDDFIAMYNCSQLKYQRTTGYCLLVLKRTHLYVLLRLPKSSADHTRLVAKHSLRSILQITCRRSQPELVTIKYGTMCAQQMLVTNIERFYIEKAGEATSAIKRAVMWLTCPEEFPESLPATTEADEAVLH